MAAGSINLDGPKGIRVMSLSYLKNSFLRKTNKTVVCGCNRGLGLNIEQEVARDSNPECIPVNVEYNKSDICKECGRAIVDKRKSGFFKSLRKRLRLKTNIGSDSVKTKCNLDKKRVDSSNCSLQNVPCDKLKEDNINNIDCSEKLVCDIPIELNEGVDVCNVGSRSNDEDSSFNEGRVLRQDFENNLVINDKEIADLKSDVQNSVENGSEQNSNKLCDEVTSNSTIGEKDYEGNECIPLPSPKSRSLTCELLKLSKYGWYWGPITREEAEEKLHDQPDGAFLVRDSSADHYLLSLSFRSSGKLLHTRIEHSQGQFSFNHQQEQEGFATIGELIDHSVSFSQSAVFCYSRPRSPGHPAFPVRLTKPVSRFTQVRSLQYLCRFIIRQYIRVDNIPKLPLPNTLKGYIQEGHY